MDTTRHEYEISIRILFYKEDGVWVAHALEMDLIGTGATSEKALDDLEKAIKAQISFASSNGHPDSVFLMAPAEFVKRWEEAHLLSIKEAIMMPKESATKLEFQASIISFSKKQIATLKSRRRASGEKWGNLAIA